MDIETKPVLFPEHGADSAPSAALSGSFVVDGADSKPATLSRARLEDLMNPMEDSEVEDGAEAGLQYVQRRMLSTARAGSVVLISCSLYRSGDMKPAISISPSFFAVESPVPSNAETCATSPGQQSTPPLVDDLSVAAADKGNEEAGEPMVVDVDELEAEAGAKEANFEEVVERIPASPAREVVPSSASPSPVPSQAGEVELEGSPELVEEEASRQEEELVEQEQDKEEEEVAAEDEDGPSGEEESSEDEEDSKVAIALRHHPSQYSKGKFPLWTSPELAILHKLVDATEEEEDVDWDDVASKLAEQYPLASGHYRTPTACKSQRPVRGKYHLATCAGSCLLC